MNSSAPPHLRRSVARQGFTLIQLLVVIGIIVLLIGLLLPTLIRARKQAARTRMTADLALIGTALEAYKQDFGDYPRFTVNNQADQTAASTVTGNGLWLDSRADRGAVLLCRCLLGPAPAGAVTSATAAPGDDGADGLGFRATRNATNYGGGTPTASDKFTGKVSGPYIQSDKFPVGGTKEVDNFQDAVLLDPAGNPILYYPALPAHGLLTNNGAYVALVNPTTTPPQLPLYNAFDNAGSGTTGTPAYLPVATLQTILHADTTTGGLVAGATPTTTAPYLLWTAGPDGIYGFDPNNKTDDVTNFDMPVNFLK